MWVTALFTHGPRRLPITLGLESQMLLMDYMTLCDFTPGRFHHLIPSSPPHTPTVFFVSPAHGFSFLQDFSLTFSSFHPSFLQGSAHPSAPLCCSLCSDVTLRAGLADHCTRNRPVLPILTPCHSDACVFAVLVSVA